MADYIRLRRRYIQTAVRCYTHPDSGRTITVIGAFHLGHPSYYQGLRELIDQLEAAGAVVHCEGSRLLTPEGTAITAAERELLDAKHRCDELQTRRFAELGWTDQVTALGYPARWQVRDLSYLQVLRQLGPDLWQQKIDSAVAMFGWPDSDRNGINRLRLKMAASMRLMANERNIPRLARLDPANPVIVHARTMAALDGVAATRGDLVLLWGVSHLPGLDAGLRDQGFALVGTPAWHTVVNVPGLPSLLFRIIRRAPASRTPTPVG